VAPKSGVYYLSATETTERLEVKLSSCLGSLLTQGLNSVLANGKQLLAKIVNYMYLFQNKLWFAETNYVDW